MIYKVHVFVEEVDEDSGHSSHLTCDCAGTYETPEEAIDAANALLKNT